LFLPEDSVDAIVVGGNILQNATDDLAVYTLQGNVSFGNNIAYATYAYTDPDASDFDELQHMELGLEHYFSERTRVWVEGIYAFNEADVADADDADALAVSLGVRHDF
jgi:predicted porin